LVSPARSRSCAAVPAGTIPSQPWQNPDQASLPIRCVVGVELPEPSGAVQGPIGLYLFFQGVGHRPQGIRRHHRCAIMSPV
jgi:hypothetical protein